MENQNLNEEISDITINDDALTTEEKPIFECNSVIPEYAFTKGVANNVIKAYTSICHLLYFLLTLEALFMYLYDVQFYKTIGLFLFIFLASVMIDGLIVKPYRRNKNYEVIHSRGEDSFHYTFYAKYFKAKSPESEMTLMYADVEYIGEDNECICLEFPLNRNIIISKSSCTNKQLSFLRKVVPAQSNSNNKFHKKYLPMIIIVIISIIWLAITIANKHNIEQPLLIQDLHRYTF